MKQSRILQTVILISIISLAAGCRSSREYPAGRYPRYPDRYPNDRPVVIITNEPNPHNLPPGQAKKIYVGKSAKPYAPGQRKKFSNTYRHYPLIIIRTPDIIISRYRNGKLYYRNADGFIYWKGYDDRFYLDEAYFKNIHYDDDEYNDWKNKGRTHNRFKNENRQ
jgi:hypothetical protein